MKFPIKLRQHPSTNTILVRIQTPRGGRWMSTGQTSYAKAREVCDQALIERLQMAAAAEVLSADVIGRLTVGKRFTCAEILEGWKENAAGDMAPNTLESYETTLRQWLFDCKLADKPLTDAHKNALSGWVNEQTVPGATRSFRLAAVRSYFKYATGMGYCFGNPAVLVTIRVRDMTFSQREPLRTTPLTAEDFRVLMASGECRGFYRWGTALSYWLGMRISEVAGLEWASIQENSIITYVPKTGRRLELPLTDPLLGAGELRGIIGEMMEKRMAEPSPYCFPEERDMIQDPKRRAILSIRYGRMLVKHGIIGKRFHSCRHAAAMRLKAAGKTLEEIGKVLGHASEKVTKIYTNHENNTGTG